MKLDKKFRNIIKNIPVKILTFDNYIEQANLCKDRIKILGFNNIDLVDGDKDQRLKNPSINKQSRSFISVCLDMVKNNTNYCFLFEEDAEFIPKRINSFKKSIIWALTTSEKWDIIYGGCVCLNPVYPYLKNLNLIYSNKGQAGGHCMLFSLQAAKKYIKLSTPDFKSPFDIDLRKLNLKCYITLFPSFYQNKNPGQIDEYKLNLIGDHSFWQDFSVIFFIFIVPIIFLLIFIKLFFHLTKYKIFNY